MSDRAKRAAESSRANAHAEADSRVILISGASSGFGQACADRLASLGHRVYGTSRRASFPNGAAGSESPVLLPMNVCEETSVREAVGFVLEREGRVDVAVNNAGVGLAGSIEDTSVVEAERLFSTNFFGIHRVCRAVLPVMRRQGDGLILNVGSLAGRVTIPFQGFYSASKYALEAFTEALRMEAAPFGVRVCLVEPGDFRTGFTQARTRAAASQGGSAYAERCERAVRVMEKDETGGADPSELARMVARIIDSPRPRLRYVAGRMSQRLAVGAKRVLPAAAVEAALRAYYRIG